MIGFHEERFPEDVSWRSSGGPIYKTHVFESFRGYEKRNIDWSQPMMKFNVAYGVKSDQQIMNVLNFFNARHGMAFGFRYKNWCNYKIVNRPIATGDGYSTRLPMWKFYGFDGARHYKRIRKIVRGSVKGVQYYTEPLVEGVDYTIDYDAGEIALPTPPAYAQPVYAQMLEFDEPVRFTEDSLQNVIDQYNSNSLSRLELMSVRGVFSAGSVFAPGFESNPDPFYNQTNLIMNFDDVGDTSTTIDQSQLALPVTLGGTAHLDPSKFRHGGGSLKMGPNGTCSMTGDPFNFTSCPFTMEAFLQYPDDGDVVQPIISKWDVAGQKKSFDLRLNFPRGRIEFAVSTDGIDEKIIMSFPWDVLPGSFDHISITRTPADWFVLRINGEVKQTVRDTVQIHNPQTPLTIGGYLFPQGGDSPYQGNIDSLRITVGRNRYEGFEAVELPAPYNVNA